MPPFSGSKQQPQNPNNVNIPNPIQLTMDHSTPNAGLDYEGTFAYQYDFLTFDELCLILLDLLKNWVVVGVNNVNDFSQQSTEAD